MFRLVHFSDPHLGPLPKVTLAELASKRLTGYVNWHRNRRKHLGQSVLDLLVAAIEETGADHVALTGDLVNLATDTEIAAAGLWLDTIDNPLHLSVVPGNHDAYVPGALSRVIDAWSPYMRGDGASIAQKSGDLFPYVRRRGKVALIGVSTATATPPFMASGYLGRSQARKLATLLRQLGEEGLCRVVMIHHPPVRGAAPNYKRMIGIRRFGAALRVGGAELVIHGHTHVNSLYRLPGRDGPVPVVGIASASQGHGHKKPPAAFNLFSISGNPGAWTIRRERHELKADLTGFRLAASDDLNPVSGGNG